MRETVSPVYEKIRQQESWEAPSSWQKIRTIDMHTGGEPLRVIVEGFPKLEGNNILEYRAFAKNNYDHLRRALMFEPRGHADMYGCILTPPVSPEADFGVLFLHNEGYSTMCGHAIIALTTLAVQLGWVEVTSPETELKIDAPCGLITSYAKVKDDQVTGVYFHCVPSFVLALDQQVDVEGIGTVTYDLAYGGAFYAYVDAKKLGISLAQDNHSELIEKGMAIKRAVMQDRSIDHPFEEDLSFLYGTIFIGDPLNEGVDSRNVCIFAEGEVDRCPTGSGVSGRMALHYAKGELQGGQMRIESITDSVFIGSIHEFTTYGDLPAVIPQVEGTAYITGQHEFLIDPQDPFKDGFILR